MVDLEVLARHIADLTKMKQDLQNVRLRAVRIQGGAGKGSSPSHSSHEETPHTAPQKERRKAPSNRRRDGGIPTETGRSDSADSSSEEDMSVIDPVPTQRQESMIWWFETFGILGLAHRVNGIAQEEKQAEILTSRRGKRKRPRRDRSSNDDGYDEQGNVDRESDSPDDDDIDHDTGGHKSWDIVINDYRQGGKSRMIYYLSSIPSELLLALLEGNIPSKMQNPQFREDFRSYTQLRQGPGSYVVYIALTDPKTQTQPGQGTRNHIGRSFSLEQLSTVVDELKEYINVDTASVQSQEKAKAIDAKLGQVKAPIGYKHARRYGSGSDRTGFNKHQGFIERIEEMYWKYSAELLEEGKHHLLRKPLERCFAYVGLAVNVQNRVPQHWSVNKSGSPVLGLMRALASYLFDTQYGIEESSYMIFRATRSDDIKLLEIVTSILASSFIWDGGLNITHAGTSIGASDWSDPRVVDKMQKFADNISQSGMMDRHIADDDEKVQSARLVMSIWSEYDSVDQALQAIASGRRPIGLTTDGTNRGEAQDGSPRQWQGRLRPRESQDNATRRARIADHGTMSSVESSSDQMEVSYDDDTAACLDPNVKGKQPLRNQPLPNEEVLEGVEVEQMLDQFIEKCKDLEELIEMLEDLHNLSEASKAYMALVADAKPQVFKWLLMESTR
ncbi:hypothetical protein PV08_11739 [Exophiala spinifera]|uniref:Uncharacterized protein n=1 Tax=Exophiala spinifera TaxID=91928 RepID=A0A0D2ATC9_9EURO|nr:uncharacterized protein PV08_11739 [Exophiala spinifera]KIW09963.1 hypothetical protein PV08_11739 [Exophiala spinifera]